MTFMNKGLRKLGEIMGSDGILREVELSSSSQSMIHDFKINDQTTISLTVPPTVYPPRRDTELMLSGLETLKVQSGGLVEIGCGSGAISIAMALAGWNVTAFDVNPLAVAATRGNAELAGIGGEITVEEGGVGEENWSIPSEADLLVWNLPYLNPDFKKNTLGPMEEAALSDEPEIGWLKTLLNLAEEEQNHGRVFILLLNTDSNSKSSPKTWAMRGWARRTLASERVGDDTLEVVAFWKPGFSSIPAYKETSESTMDDARKLPLEGWQRIRAGEQISGRGRRGAIWHSSEGDMTASWSVSIEVLNRWTPGLLQVAIGASISEALGVELKWPNDLIFEGKKCGGILLESSTADGRVRIGVGLNKYRREYEGIFYSGWNEYMGEKDSEVIFQIIDASIASILDPSPPIPTSDVDFWKRKCWDSLSRNLSRGTLTEFNKEYVKIVGLSDSGELKSISKSSIYEIHDVGEFVISS